MSADDLDALVNQRQFKYTNLYPDDICDSNGLVKYKLVTKNHFKVSHVLVARSATSLSSAVLHPLITEEWGVIQVNSTLDPLFEFCRNSRKELNLDLDDLVKDPIVRHRANSLLQSIDRSPPAEELGSTFYFLFDRVARTLGLSYFRMYETTAFVGGLFVCGLKRPNEGQLQAPLVEVTPTIMFSNSDKTSRVSVHGDGLSAEQAMIEAVHSLIGHRSKAAVVLSSKYFSVLWLEKVGENYKINRFTMTDFSDLKTLILITACALVLIGESKGPGGSAIGRVLKITTDKETKDEPPFVTLIGPNNQTLTCPTS